MRVRFMVRDLFLVPAAVLRDDDDLLVVVDIGLDPRKWKAEVLPLLCADEASAWLDVLATAA